MDLVLPTTSTSSPCNAALTSSSIASSNSERKTQVRFNEHSDILLLKAALALAPWLAEHGQTLAKWDAVADDFNLATKGIFLLDVFDFFLMRS